MHPFEICVAVVAGSLVMMGLVMMRVDYLLGKADRLQRQAAEQLRAALKEK